MKLDPKISIPVEEAASLMWKFGVNRTDHSNALVVTRLELNADDLISLLNREVAAVRVPGYCDEKLCDVLGENLLSNRYRGNYVNAPAIGRVGQAFFESQACETSRTLYTAMAVRWLKDMRASCAPFLSPIDRVRLELDELWIPGSVLACANNAKMFAGLTRIFGEGGGAEPHTDVLAWDSEGLSGMPKISRQLALNVYLRVPEAGGELVLWDLKPDRETYERYRNGNSYGLRQDALPDPDVTITPQKGEMIIFNPEYVHAVMPVKNGQRVTSSSFIGYTDPTAPLVIWS